MSHNDLLVSVIIPTYNHEKYIERCLESIYQQEVDFRLQIVIGDDCSTDNTRDIVKSLVAKYQDDHIETELLFYPEKLTEPEVVPGKLNWMECLKACKGQYIASCEGDDYWIDPAKLQKQVSFLEQNPSYILCGGKWKILKDDRLQEDSLILQNSSQTEFTSADFTSISTSPMHTATLLFRNVFAQIDFSWEAFKFMPIGDIPLCFILGLHGKIKRLDAYLSVYNRQNETSTTKFRKIDSIAKWLFHMFEYLDELSAQKYTRLFKTEQRFVTNFLRYQSKEMSRFQRFFFLWRNRKRFQYSLRDIIYIIRH